MNATMNKVLDNQCGFLTQDDVAELIDDYADMQVLIRTGMNRYLCPMNKIEDTIELVSSKGDYVRDVGLTSKNANRIRRGENYLTATGITAVHPD